MAGWGPITEHIRIQKEAARLRAVSLRNRILALGTFCGIARSQVQLGMLTEAQISLKNIRRGRAEIESSLRNPHYVSGVATDELWELLKRVDPGIQELERSIRNSG
jgi:hypothetical protein